MVTWLYRARHSLEAPWSTRELWGGFGIALALYLVGSLVGALLLEALGGINTPLLGVVMGPIQVGMALPPLLIMRRYGSLGQLLGLHRFEGRMLLEVVFALGLGFWGAMLWGVFLLAFGQRAQEPIVPFFGEGAWAFVSVFGVAAILAPLVEEILFRGFLFGGLRTRLSPLRAALVSGAIFGAIHLQPLAFPALFLLGVLLALLYHRTGSLWAPILMHFCINAFAVVGQFVLASEGLL